MIDALIFVLLLAGAVGSGLIGGLFFAFSSFIMKAFDRLAPSHAIAAMQAINVTILNPLFFLAFFGTAALSLCLLILALSRWGAPAAPFMLAGAVAYLAGSILVTMVLNVPLNDRLAAIRPAGDDLAMDWHSYRTAWTWWNHVRTICSLAAAAFFFAGVWFR